MSAYGEVNELCLASGATLGASACRAGEHWPQDHTTSCKMFRYSDITPTYHRKIERVLYKSEHEITALQPEYEMETWERVQTTISTSSPDLSADIPVE